MPRTCTVCDSPNRADIDRALVEGRGIRTIAHSYDVGEYSVRRHRKTCLPELIAKAYEAERQAEATRLLTDVKQLQVHTLKALMAAESAENWGTMLKAVREARGNIALLFEVEGKISRAPTINVYHNEQWIITRDTLVAALDPYPEARLAASKALLELEGGSNGR